MLPTTDLPLSDYIHNSSCGNVRLGVRAAQLCAQVLCGGREAMAPDLVQASAGDREIVLTFAHVSGELLVLGGRAASQAFSIFDAQGAALPVRAVRRTPGRADSLTLETEAPVPRGSAVSFAWTCDPPAASILDSVTRMPPLSFFGVPLYVQGRAGQ